MRNTPAIVLGVIAVCASVVTAADAPYIGKWKMNSAKSSVTGQTLSIEKTASGAMRYDSGGFAYEFKTDGKEYPLPDGGTTAWKAVDAKTWDVTNRKNGKATANYRLVLDGDTMTFQSVLSKADGGTLNESGKATRVSGGPGFMGKWKISDAKIAVTTMDIAANGADGVTIQFPEQGATCRAKFDGKDYPLTGTLVGNGSAYALKKTGARSFEITEKLNGKPMYVDKINVSDDGKTLVMDGTPTSANEPVKFIYDRQ
jgi:hypothetical protein